MSDVHGSISRYYRTKIKDFYLDIWAPVFIPSSVLDEIYVVEPQYAGRPDLLSNKKFGTVDLWWVFAIANPDSFIDPVDDLVAGMTITIPSMTSIEKLF